MIQNKVKNRLPPAKNPIISDNFIPTPVKVSIPKIIPAAAHGTVIIIIRTAPSFNASITLEILRVLLINAIIHKERREYAQANIAEYLAASSAINKPIGMMKKAPFFKAGHSKGPSPFPKPLNPFWPAWRSTIKKSPK